MGLMKYWNIRLGDSCNQYLAKVNKVLLLCCLLVHTFFVYAQYNTFSPFSRYGIGDIQENTLAYQKAMNNSGIAQLTDTTAPAFINISNPATLSSLRLTILDAGVNYYHTQIINQQNYKVTQKSVNFNSLAIAFPVKKHSGFCFGILPYSFVGYKINQNEYINNIGNINYVYDGSGGLNKVFAAYGFSISKYFRSDSSQGIIKTLIKNLSFGINAHYLFGELAQTAVVNYPSNITYYHFVNDRRYRINGLSADVGLQTFLNLKDNKSLLAMGWTMSVPSQLKVINDYIAYNFSYTYFGEKYIVDTLLYSENEAGKLKLPLSTALGLSYIVNHQWGINIDGRYTDWNKFQLANDKVSVKNNFEINIGGYVQPDRFSMSKGDYLKKIIYRAGIGYNSGYQEYQGKAVPLYAFSAGVSLPMGLYRAFSALHISAQYAIKGQKSFILKENILKINIGITLNDRWFIKYKYD